jgi:hypothetical protein
VEYSDETGARSSRTFTDWQDARDAFLALAALADLGEDHGFPHPSGWDLIGWESDTTAAYGYTVPLGYADGRGNATVSLSYTRED